MSYERLEVPYDPRERCEIGPCEALATWMVTGQWTIADWLHVYACGEHLLDAHEWLSRRTVDGERCLERRSQWIGERDV